MASRMRILLHAGSIIHVYTVEPLYSRHHWDCSKCPDYRGVLISEVGLYRNVVIGTLESVLIIEVSSFQNVLSREVPLYTVICKFSVSLNFQFLSEKISPQQKKS